MLVHIPSTSICIMNVQIADIKVISMGGYKSQWRVYPEDVIAVGGESFVRLKPYCTGLKALISENNEHLPSRKWKSLTETRGWQNIIQMRTDASVTETPNDSSEPCLFDTTNKQVKRPRKSRALIKHERALDKEVVEIKIEVDGQSHNVSIIKAILPKDSLYVQCDSITIGLVVKYIRDKGFAEKECLPEQCRRHLPSGKILTWHIDEQNKTKYKLTDDVTTALMWQSGMAECHGVHDDDGEHAEAASGDDGTEPAGDDEDGGCA